MNKFLLASTLVLAALLLVLSALTLSARSQPVCHSLTEDSVIADCDYRAGGWYRK